MGKIVYVHGTGVREPAYTKSLDEIKETLAEFIGKDNFGQWQIASCYWGDVYGAKLWQKGESIPDYQQVDSEDDISEEDEKLTLWEILYRDPFYELRLLTLKGESGQKYGFNQIPPWEVLEKKLNQFKPSDEFKPSDDMKALLRQSRLDEVWDEAFQAIVNDPIFSRAIRNSQEGEAAPILARAIVAQAIVLSVERGRPLIDGSSRDLIAKQVVKELAETYKSLSDWLISPFKGMALHYLTRKAKRKRGPISDGISPIAGDILLYQTRGKAIRKFIFDEIQKTAENEKIYLLAHSLGGIACVDLLVLLDLSKKVEGLITVGSQSPLLYEMNSLFSLRYGKPLPPHFPRWLNIYDRNDFLGYIGEKIFPGRIEDFEVRSHQPFPQAHSAYWSNQKLWEKVTAFIK